MFWVGHPYKVKFDLFIIALSCYNAFSIPLQISFEPAFLESRYFFWVDFVINIMFAVDILVNFWSAYINTKTGVEIQIGWLVALNYIKTRFFIDLIATIPFDFIMGFFMSTSSPIFQLIGLIKLVRILRLTKLLSFLNTQASDMSNVIIATDVFYLVVYLHCFACTYFYFIRDDQHWLPVGDDLNVDLYEQPWYRQYSLILYYSTVNFFGSDMYPNNNLSTFIAIMGGVFGIFIFAKLTGDIVVSQIRAARHDMRIDEKIQISWMQMKNLEIKWKT